MRWTRVIGFFVFGLFLCVAAVTVFLETAPGIRALQRMLLRSLEQSGLHVEIASISGQLPEQMDLRGVTISRGEQTISVERLQFELSLIRLLKREVFVRSLEATGIRFQGTSGEGLGGPLPVLVKVQSFRLEKIEGLDGMVLTGKVKAKKEVKLELTVAGEKQGTYAGTLSAVGTWDAWKGVFSGKYAPTVSTEWVKEPWTFRGNVRKQEGLWEVETFTAENKFLQLHGTGELDRNYKLLHGQLQLAMPSTKFFATTELSSKPNGLGIRGQWRLPTLPVEGSWEGTLVSRTFVGTTNARGLWMREPFSATSHLTYRFRESLQLEQFVLESPLAHASGDFVLRPDLLWVGKGQFQQLQLHALRVPELSGTAEGKCVFEVSDELKQVAHLDARGSEVFWKKLYAKEALVYADIRENGKSRFHVGVKGGQWKELLVETAEADFGQSGPFQLTLDGTWKESLHLAASGEMQPGQLKLARFQGSVLNHSVALTSPAEFAWNTNTWDLKPLAVSVGNGTLVAEGNSSGTLTLHTTQLPLDFLELTPLHIPVKGTVDANASFTQKKGQTEGTWDIAVHGLQVSGRERKAEGTIAGTLVRERMQLQTVLQSKTAKLFALDADVPVQMQLWPFAVHFPSNKPVEGRLTMDGAIEDVLDFFDLGTHRFAGHWVCDLLLRGTLGNPRLEGHCDIRDGSYENYLTGTVLTQMQASIVAEQTKLRLQTLSAVSGNGKLSGSGSLALSKREKFPFSLDLDFTQLNVAQIDLVSATAEGHISIHGNLDGADAKGKVQVLEAKIAIPEQIPMLLPELPVVYKNSSPTVSQPTTLPYPLRLELEVQAPKGIFIEGRGLNSEWQGNFQIGGTYTSIATKGMLELLGGNFVFSGREFQLTQGALSFSGREYEMPSIDLSGHMAERGILITARLHGPLNHPELTFQSTPPLPFGSIMSYLLFGKDISEIDGFQAIQLASSVASISGTSPDVLETTRKSLGIDRLRIISSGSSEDGETISLQVGKYVAKGVLVSFSQGADDSSSNVSIEVDLKHGFVFQAETEQQEEQGKFTLKWNTNY